MREKIQALIKKGFFDIFGASVLNKVITFLSSIVLVRVLSKTEYGLFSYVWNIYNIVMLVCGMGFDSGFLQLASEKPDDKRYRIRLYGYCIRIGNLFNLLLSAILIIIALFTKLKFPDARGLFVFVAFLPLFQHGFRMMSVDLRAIKDNRKYALLNNINTLFISIFSVIGALWLKDKGLILGYYVAYIFTFVFALWVIKEPLKYRGNLQSDEKKQLYSISIISVCNNSLSQLLYLLDVFIIAIVIPSERVLANYKVATQIPTAFAFIPQAVVVFIYPYFAEHNRDSKWCISNFKKLIGSFSAFNFLISTGLFVFAPIIIKLVYGTQYLDVVSIFRVLSISYFFSASFRTIVGNLLVTQRKLKFNLFMGIFIGLLNIITDCVFITNYGSIGAAYATLISVLVDSVISTTYLCYVFKNERNNDF